MLLRLPFLIFVFYLSKVVTGDESSDVQISGTNDKCAEFCSKSYSAHTFERSGAEQSCKQGCRLCSIIQFADKMKSPRTELSQSEQAVNFTAMFMTCDRECDDAYSDEIFKRACFDGCQHQIPITGKGQVRVVIDDSSPFFPFASKLLNDAMGKFGGFKDQMKSQLDNLRKWFNSDDSSPGHDQNQGNDDTQLVSSLDRMGDSLLNFFRQINTGLNPALNTEQQQRKPMRLGGAEDVFDHLPNRGQESNGQPVVASSRPVHKEGSEFDGLSSVGNEDENGVPIIIVKMIPVDVELESAEAANEPSPPSSGDVMYADADDGWLACLARRTQNLSMLSRWLLCAALMTSLLCMFWLCLALIRTQRHRRNRLYTQYRAGKSDVIYFTPPPAYEKNPASAAYLPLNKEEQKVPPSPPPAYEASLECVKTEIPKAESV